MQKLIKNTLSTTGLTLIILALIATIYRAHLIFVSSIYESLLVNFIIQIGLGAVQKFESKYFIIEILLENFYVQFVLIIAGYLFHWYRTMPIWVLVIMGITIYTISYFVNMIRIHDDIAFINRQLKAK